jgi:hypothetical protein
MMLILKPEGGTVQYYWFNLPEDGGGATIIPVGDPAAPDLPEPYRGDQRLYDAAGGLEIPYVKVTSPGGIVFIPSDDYVPEDYPPGHTVEDYGKSDIVVPPIGGIVFKNIEFDPAEFPDGYDFGASPKRLAFCLGGSFYYETSYTLEGVPRELIAEKRPRIASIAGGAPVDPYPSVQLNGRTGILLGNYLNSQDPTNSQGVPGAVVISDSGEIGLIEYDFFTTIVRNAESVYYFGPTYDPVQTVQSFGNLRYKNYTPLAEIINDIDIDELYTTKYTEWPYKLGAYNTPVGTFTNDTLRVPVRATLSALGDSFTFTSLQTEGEGEKELYTGEFKNDFEFTTLSLSDEYDTVEFRGVPPVSGEDTGTGQPVLNTEQGDPNSFVELVKTKLKLSSVKTLWDNGAISYYEKYKHTVLLKINGATLHTFHNTAEGWYTPGSIEVQFFNTGKCVNYPEILDVVTYAQLQESDVDIVVYSKDTTVSYNHSSEYDEGPTTISLYDPANPEVPLTYDAKEINTFLMTWRSEVKFYISLDGVELPISMPEELWSSANGGQTDADGNPILDGVKGQLHDAHNAARLEFGMECTYDLSPDSFLERVAQYKVDDMVATGVFSHTGSKGDTITDRPVILGVPLVTISENLAFIQTGSPDEPTPEQISHIISSWLDSPGHRTTLLNPNSAMVGYAFGYRPEEGKWFFAVEFLYCKDDPITIPGVYFDSNGDWFSGGFGWEGCTNPEGCSGVVPPLGSVYDREQSFISETVVSTQDNQIWDENVITGIYTNDVSPKDSQGNAVDPMSLPGVEMRDVSISRYGNLVMITFLLSKVWRQKPAWYEGSGYRSIVPTAGATEDLEDRVFQLYSISEKKLIWNGKIIGDRIHMTAGFVDLVGDLSAP